MNGHHPDRDDFPQRIKAELASKTGYHCSMPACCAPTSGPSDSRTSGASNVGIAAHITAASPGGPRYDAELSKEDRQSYGNGIWLCQNHAKLIDDDEARYAVDLLTAWRQAAEARAREEQGLPMARGPSGSRALVAHQRMLGADQGGLREGIHDFLVDVGASQAWGNHYQLIRMVLYELALNSVQHGGASTVELTSNAGTVMLRDQGQRFGLAELRAGGQGGHQAISDLAADATGAFILTYRFTQDRNEWCVADQIEADGTDVPCGIVARGRGREEIEALVSEARGLGDCTEVHLYPDPLWSYSDWGPIVDRLKEVFGDRLIIHNIRQNRQIVRMIQRDMPDAVLPD